MSKPQLYVLCNVDTGKAKDTGNYMHPEIAKDQNRSLLLRQLPFAYIEANRIIDGFCKLPPQRRSQ